MKSTVKFAAGLVAALALLLFALPAAAAGIEVVGAEEGLVLIPSGGDLFDLDALSPGDTLQGTIKLRNDYSRWYHLWIKAAELTADEPSLFEVMELTVDYRGELLYQGKVDGFAADKEIYLGRYEPGDVGELVVTAHLPGAETGNEYQGKSASVKWIFSAQASEEVVVEPEEPGLEPEEPGPGEAQLKPERPGLLPRTFGEGMLYSLFLVGTLLLLFGAPLIRRRRGQER